MQKAHKVQQGVGQKGNRNYPKENLVNTHKKSKIKGLVDERTAMVGLIMTHPRRCTLNKTIECYKVVSEIKKWQKDGYKVELINNF